MVGTNNLDKATGFYDILLDVIDLKRIEKTDTYGSYAPKSNPEAVEFYVTTPFNEEKATVGNGSQISFQTSSRELVDKFHDVGIKLGGASEGSGGERPEGSGVYYSYIRDLDGNKICAFTNNQ